MATMIGPLGIPVSSMSIPDQQRRLDQMRQSQKTQAEKDAEELARTDRFVNYYRDQRNQDMAEGRARGEQLFGDGALGRVSEGRSADMSDIVARRRAQLSGFTPEERNAMESGVIRDLDRNTQVNLRALRGIQGRQGLAGGTAAAQQVGVLRDAADREAGVRRDLFLQDMNLRRNALDNLEGTISRAEADELARQQFNLGQADREKFGRLTTEFGYAGLGQADRSAVAQRLAGSEAAEAQRQVAESMAKK